MKDPARVRQAGMEGPGKGGCYEPWPLLNQGRGESMTSLPRAFHIFLLSVSERRSHLSHVSFGPGPWSC